MKTIGKYDLVKIPSKVAVCPICGAEVIIDDVDEYEQDDNGLWRISESGLHINCITEPDIDGAEWWEWMGVHWGMPYVDWLPLEHRVWRWLNAHYRFRMAE